MPSRDFHPEPEFVFIQLFISAKTVKIPGDTHCRVCTILLQNLRSSNDKLSHSIFPFSPLFTNCFSLKGACNSVLNITCKLGLSHLLICFYEIRVFVENFIVSSICMYECFIIIITIIIMFIFYFFRQPSFVISGVSSLCRKPSWQAGELK